MLDSITDHELYLYHYTNAEAALKITRSGSLKLGRFRRTNDPKESKDWRFHIGTNENREYEHREAEALSEWLCAELKDNTRLACFCTDRPGLSGQNTRDLFHRGYTKPRMWAQYAANHSGVCLIFRKDLLLKSINAAFDQSDLVMTGPVRYRDRPIVPNLFSPDEQQYAINGDALAKVGKDEYFGMHVNTHHARLFFEKMTDWAAEDEWRVVAFVKSPEEYYLPYRDSLVGVMFGDDTKEADIEALVAETRSLAPWYMGLKWRNCTPWYDYANPGFIRQYCEQTEIAT